MWLYVFLAVVAALFYLSKTNTKVNFMLKYIYCFTVVICVGIVFIPIFLLRPKNVANLLMGAYVARTVIPPVIGVKWAVHGMEHLKEDRAAVIVANHQSSLDLLGMYEVWPMMKKCTAVAKRELLYFLPFGFASWLGGVIFINRMNGEKSREAINSAGDVVKEKKLKIWLFPEGTRRNTGEIHEFKKGAFHLAISAQIPVIPVVFSRYYFIDEKKKFFRDGQVAITALEAIPTAGMTAKDVDKLIEMTRKVMVEAYDKANKQYCPAEAIRSSTK
ncbi:PREDICTED: 1-acyl-sn-glycerol-3-phosphate acyltransferase beta-like [Nicrophorus vespilloides]|uniref:1-acyl-sn-glycerol-3-phosphate acyltransferase n=1 Tax=Nicrophorus vespilloides TaxID=110193 RepID=A0ABM1M3C3_NICVS|nr:PREDICTED: 1-acyl-sn-glycerol-3-phosphate acyltransferase beta-like [Nicrophorus vespilloides]